MAYDVDFWYVSQDACQITTDFTPFSEHDVGYDVIKIVDNYLKENE